MSRTARYRLAYVGVLSAIAVGAGVLVFAPGGGIEAAIASALLLFVPGRIQGFYYRDLFTARRLLDAGQPERALPLLERFVASIERHPGRRRLLWLSWSIYTPDVLAMAANNRGAAHLELGHVDRAEQAFLDALHRDPLYPLPHVNLAAIHELRGDRAAAAEAVGEARRLGYTGGTLDAVVLRAQSLLARMEGRSRPTR